MSYAHLKPYQQQSIRHFFPLLWLLVTSFAVFGLYISWDLGFLQMVFERDRSYLTSVIAMLTFIASGHALWHNLSANSTLVRLQDSTLLKKPATLQNTEQSIHPRENRSIDQKTEAEIEIIADRLRAPVEFGWFLVDLAIRLGLAGTIIGFILIFTSLSGEAIVGENALRELLVSMSAGMGTALFTTLTGLTAATFLSFQYLMLGRVTEAAISEILINEFSDADKLLAQPAGQAVHESSSAKTFSEQSSTEGSDVTGQA